MKWSSPLIEATILKRYKRFLADIELEDKKIVAHVPNTGSMESCWKPHWKCAVSLSDNPKRKMPYTLEMIHNSETWIGVNTANANKLAKNWLENNLIPGLSGYKSVLPEKKIDHSRLDFYLEGHSTHPDCYVEVKSVTLKRDGLAQFPDSVSERGQKHLLELLKLKNSGFRAAMLFIVQREDVDSMKPADSTDPEYAKLLRQVYDAGVEIFIYQCKMDLEQLSLLKSLPLQWD